MIYVALGFSLLIGAFGVLGLFLPAQAVATARRFATRGGMYFAGALRLVMGAALYLAAPASRSPDVLHVIGVVVIIAGITTFFFSPERLQSMMEWWEAKGPVLVRLQGVFAIGVGVLLAWLLLP